MATKEKTMEMSRIALYNALNEPQLLNTLSQYGYGVEHLQEGLAHYESARALVQSHSDSRQNKVAASKNFRQRWQEAQYHYHHDLRAARLALKGNEESRYFLQLTGDRDRSFDRWQEQAKNFYLGLRDKPELQTLVAKAGVTTERIERGIQLLQALATERLQVFSHKGSAGDSLRTRDEAFAALNQWMITFRGVARIAFAKTPAHLATLGLEPEARKPLKGGVMKSEAVVMS